MTAAVGAGHALATPPHTGCASVLVGQASGWCGLYPGNATNNDQEQGQVALSSDGSVLTIETTNTADGQPPATSFACLTATPAAQITNRLQDEQCTNAYGGVWITWTGASTTVALASYPQFLGSTFTVQVAANHDAGDGNGDAFYNNFGVDDTGAVGAS